MLFNVGIDQVGALPPFERDVTGYEFLCLPHAPSAPPAPPASYYLSSENQACSTLDNFIVTQEACTAAAISLGLDIVTPVNPNGISIQFGCTYKPPIGGNSARLIFARESYLGWTGQLQGTYFWKSVCVAAPPTLPPIWDIGYTNYLMHTDVLAHVYTISEDDWDSDDLDSSEECLDVILEFMPTTCPVDAVLGDLYVYFTFYSSSASGTTYYYCKCATAGWASYALSSFPNAPAPVLLYRLPPP